MKRIKHVLSLLFLPFILTSCISEINCKDALETSNSVELKEGYKYRISNSDIIESFFVINPPLNKEASEEEYVYDISWELSQNLSWYTLGDGLVGKKIISVTRLADNIIQINMNRPCEDKTATSGYIKINPKAFKSKSQRTKMAYLYAYVAIGQYSGIVEK